MDIMKKAIVIGGSRGIGKAISDSLKTMEISVIATSKNELDTSNLENVKKFVENHNHTDILVLNTGGPPGKDFFFCNWRRMATFSQTAFLRVLFNPTKNYDQWTRLYFFDKFECNKRTKSKVGNF